ncbi:MAG: NADH-quinone oxidoreductase subunit B family protein [Planctomycetota bacterium]|jgi:coenzyme F420-reducing hydrogenase gamma subunit
MSKPRVAIFDFACCEGCQLQIVNLEEEILDLIELVDVVEWREAMSEQSHEYDIAIIEGSITRPEDAKRLEVIRSRAKILIALGACATMGGVNKMKNNFDLDEVRQCVYGADGKQQHLHTEMTKSVGEVVEVDFNIPGCPINGAEFAQIIRSLLLGKTPFVPDYPVCVECKANENICRYEYGEICLGPIIRAGCGAPCPTAKWRCFGCRGMVENPNVEAAQEVMDKYNLTIDDLQQKLVLFNTK